MPQFQLDTSGSVEAVGAALMAGDRITHTESQVAGWRIWNDLDPFTQGYIEALFFTNQSCIPMVEFHSEESQTRIREGQADGDLPNDAGFPDLHPDALATIIQECAEFQREVISPTGSTVADMLTLLSEKRDYSAEQAGRDFWFTRNGHGVGFWDRGIGAAGNILSDAARKAGERNPYFSEPDATSPTGYGFVRLY